MAKFKQLNGTRNLGNGNISVDKLTDKERTGAQVLAAPLAGGILYPSYNDELPLTYNECFEQYADYPIIPCDDLSTAPANDAFAAGTTWQFFYARRALWYRAIRQMRRDPTINYARVLAIAPALASEWSFEETKGKAPPDAKEWIRDEIEPFRLHLLMHGMKGCLDFGWQSFEQVRQYMKHDRKIHIRKLKPLLPDLTHIRVNQKNGAFVGLQQFQNFASVETNAIINIDLKASLLYYIDEEGTNWYGNSVMRIAELPYRCWMNVNSAAIQYDRKIAGSHWVVSYPIGTTLQNGKEVDNFLIAQQIIQTLEHSGAVAIPTMLASYIDDLNSVGGQFASEKRDWRVEIMSDGSAGATSFDTRLRYLDGLKLRAFGLGERTALEGQFGTKAEAGEHIDFALTNIETRHKQFCQMTNWHVINPLLRANWGKQYENTVYIKPSPLSDATLAYLRTLYMKLLELPSCEPQEVANINFEAIKDRLGIPINDEDLEDEDTEAPKDELMSVDDVLSSISPIGVPLFGTQKKTNKDIGAEITRQMMSGQLA